MKKLFAFTIIVLAAVIYLGRQTPHYKTVVIENETKDSTPVQKAMSQQKVIKKPKRKMASVPAKTPTFLGKEVYGLQDTAKLEKGEIRIINEIDPNWDEELKHQLTSYLPMDANISMRPEKSYVQVVGDRAYFRERVKVTISSKRLGKSSYRALVDPSNAQVLRTWERTKFDANPYVRSFRFSKQ